MKLTWANAQYRRKAANNMEETLKMYTIEVHGYPKTFSFAADTEKEAIEKAVEAFHEFSNGASVWSVEVTDVESA